MSFLNAGDRETASAEALPDACAGFSCGNNGQCVAVNMTPTCVCDQGFVAVGELGEDGTRSMRCVEPPELVPVTFYEKRLPSLPSELPGGRDVQISEPVPMPGPGDGTGSPVEPPSTAFPMPRSNPELAAASASSGGGCGVAGAATSGTAWLWTLVGAAAMRRRRTRSC